jgi:ectoine hydroxylase-related dioxygenase (phytanoyl-CoA dioxygenase family)
LLLPSYKPELLWDRYLSDVNEGDGGLLVVESSHKAAFERPTPHLFAPFGGGNPVPADQVAGVPWDMRAAVGLKNVVPVRAGDVLVMPEALTHAVMP